jgi:peptidoglycan/xylan/chitin deacetylase (PgdA/CDA1 family)
MEKSIIKDYGKQLIYWVSRRFPVNYILGGFELWPKIFCLHRVLPKSESFNSHPGSEFVLTIEAFERFLTYISQHYECLTLSDAIRQENRVPSRRVCHVTFDDGFVDNYEHALPLLLKYNIPATIYLTEGFVGREVVPLDAYIVQLLNNQTIPKGFIKSAALLVADSMGLARGHLLPSGLPLVSKMTLRSREEYCNRLQDITKVGVSWSDYLSWRQCRKLSQCDLIEIGSHTRSHPNLAIENNATLDAEIIKSKERLESELNVPIRHFAYPYGGKLQINKVVMSMVTSAGFETATTTHCTTPSLSNSFYLPRFFITNQCAPQVIEARTGGLCNLVGKQIVPGH